MAVSPHIVHPVQIAMAAATLDELAPGRVVLCLGTGAPRDLADAGLEPRRPLRALRESLELTRLLLAGETVHYDGEVFRAHGHALASGRRAVPIFLAASGPQTLALAGAAADGVLLSNASSVEFVRWPSTRWKQGQGTRPQASRTPHTGRTPEEASAGYRNTGMVHHRGSLASTGRDPALAEANNLIGNPASLLEKVAFLDTAGVDHVCAIQFPQDSIAEMLEHMEWFARDVIAPFRGSGA
jgi:alkanesulfonate monooxygenase SsuD/methylene tetrahydromethanopterin reductase-like flavin-dependent oxidoreductase (luciferase family)